MAEALDIAIAGTRGVPACYGGFETFAEELGKRLVARGHRVTVYGRVAYVGSVRRRYLGMDVIPVWAPRGKHLETPLHTLASAVRASRRQHDVVLLCNAANAFTLPLFAWGGAKTVLNVDGIERQRKKWGLLGRAWFALGERLSLALADVPLADAECVRDYYQQRYGRELFLAAYGGDRFGAQPAAALARYGLTPGRYVLVVGRLEPENNALFVARAWSEAGQDLPLVVVGDAPYAHAYKAELEALAAREPRLILTGGVYGAEYAALQQHAACYVAAGEVGGTHPALLEAMAMGATVVANDVPEHREVLGEGGLYYASDDGAGLVAAIERVLAHPPEAEALKAAARRRVAERYRWELVTDRYEALFRQLCGQTLAEPQPASSVELVAE